MKSIVYDSTQNTKNTTYARVCIYISISLQSVGYNHANLPQNKGYFDNFGTSFYKNTSLRRVVSHHSIIETCDTARLPPAGDLHIPHIPKRSLMVKVCNVSPWSCFYRDHIALVEQRGSTPHELLLYYQRPSYVCDCTMYTAMDVSQLHTLDNDVRCSFRALD